MRQSSGRRLLRAASRATCSSSRRGTRPRSAPFAAPGSTSSSGRRSGTRSTSTWVAARRRWPCSGPRAGARSSTTRTSSAGAALPWRTTDRAAPHNVYTDGRSLRNLAALGAAKVDESPAGASPPTPRGEPAGRARIDLAYPYNQIGYATSGRRTPGAARRRGRSSATGRTTGSWPHERGRDGGRLRPARPHQKGAWRPPTSERAGLDSPPTGHRQGNWRKASARRHRFYDAKGRPATLTSARPSCR